MLKSIFLGGLIGGLVLFAWGVVSWMLLPWHLATLEKFTDEATVAQALAANAPKSAVYILPNAHKYEPGMTEEQRKMAEAEGMKRMMQGPVMFAALRPQGASGMGSALPVQLFTGIMAAILATWLLAQATLLDYWQRVGFVVMLALTAGVVCHIPYWNWWGFSASYTAVTFADLLVSWFLAGLVIAKMVPATRR
jgi:hypothetical protein